MSGHVELSIAGWWAGVLHPMETPDHLITLLIVGVLGGMAVRAGRSSWTLPVIFLTGLLSFGLVGLGIDHTFHFATALIVLSAVLAVLVFVHPRHTAAVSAVVVFASGALHGLAHGTDASAHVRSVGYIAGFLFTSCVLMSVGSIVGAATGRALRRRRPVPAERRRSATDDHALV